jgi:hypothetical protein
VIAGKTSPILLVYAVPRSFEIGNDYSISHPTLDDNQVYLTINMAAAQTSFSYSLIEIVKTYKTA